MSTTKGMYYTPMNSTHGTDNGTIPAAGFVNPPYHIVSIQARLASLGVELALSIGEMYKTQMTPEQIAALSNKVEKLTAEILQLSENWPESNE